MTYRPEGGDESSLQLSDPAATGITLTDLRNNTNYTITVVATAGEYRRESMARTVLLPQQGIELEHLCICLQGHRNTSGRSGGHRTNTWVFGQLQVVQFLLQEYTSRDLRRQLSSIRFMLGETHFVVWRKSH